MPLDVRLFPCLSDNYGFLVRDAATGAVATVDTPDADAILADLERSGWGRLDLILNTHWHPDHTQGNAALKAATGWCAHEYTAANARFALSLDDRPQMAARAAAVFAARERGQPTVPTTVGAEKAFNPFLRAADADDFAARRAAKDSFAG